jgi:hypothetical protein
MKEIAIKLEITNSRNDDKRVEWFFCDTEEEKKQWIDEKKKEEDEWNYHTVGAVSMRYYSFSVYSISNLMETDISKLEGMKLRDFIGVIKNCL